MIFYEELDVQNLDQVQRLADQFFRSHVPNLKDSKLVNGIQDGKYFKYQYIGENAPIRVTEVAADRVDEETNKFKLIETVQSFAGPVENGRLTSISKTYSIASLEDALENLEWD